MQQILLPIKLITGTNFADVFLNTTFQEYFSSKANPMIITKSFSTDFLGVIPPVK